MQAVEKWDHVASHIPNPLPPPLQARNTRQSDSLTRHGASLYRLSMTYDDIAARIEAFDNANGGGVGHYEDKGACHLYLLETDAPIARLKPTGNGDEVRVGYSVKQAPVGRPR